MTESKNTTPNAKLDWALWWANLGFSVFPLIPDGKLPLIDGWQHRATQDAQRIKDWWTCPVMGTPQDYNVGILTSQFSTESALWVVDVDNKGAKQGDHEILKLEMEGKEFPPTLEQSTPTGGRHLIYLVDRAVRSGANVLAPGLDIRSDGGFIVGAGSETERGRYEIRGSACEPARAPAWYIEYAGRGTADRSANRAGPAVQVDPNSALLRAVDYLQNRAPLAVEGSGGDSTTFAVACKVKDFGLDASACLVVLLEHWNPRCQPPWQSDELQTKVENAYEYGKEIAGAAAPEAQFAPIRNPAGGSAVLPGLGGATESGPLVSLNKEYAFVLAGGGSHVLWETVDARGQFHLVHLNESAFHKKHAAQRIIGDGKKSADPLTEVWMRWTGRRSYDGLCFMPGEQAPPRFYNLWRGFAVEPWPADQPPPARATAALDAWLDHAHRNVCGDDKTLSRWLIGFLAHMVQQPQDKPLVALVFRGSKGVGKNALIERFGFLLGSHFLIANNRRYLVGNFNDHLERLLCFVLNEAFWSGDKQAEGVLKDLITGAHHVIEPKGEKVYAVENRTRIVIIGNEDWIVPASHDERRFAVFNVGEARKQDRAFFTEMKKGMEAGGYRVLLRYLMNYDLTGLDFNAAPQTQGLLDQKHASLEPFDQWWFDCLSAGHLVGSDLGGTWVEQVETDRFRAAFRRYATERNVRTRLPSDTFLGRSLARSAPGVRKRRVRRGQELLYVYEIPSLAVSRAAWEKFIGQPMSWEVNYD